MSKNKNISKLLFSFIVFCSLSITIPAEAFGKPRGGGGSRSSGSKSSSSKSSSSKNNSSRQESAKSNNSGWGSKKETTTTNNNSTSKTSTSNPTKTLPATSTPSKPTTKSQTQADKKLHERAKQNGTLFSNRQEAVQSFTQKNGDSLKKTNPVTFNSEPTTRPNYIPHTHTSPTGQSYNVSYYPNHGGYGYMDALGMFIMYDILTNDNFVNQQMAQQNYAYGPAPVVQNKNSASPFVFIVTGILIVAFCVIIYMIIINR